MNHHGALSRTTLAGIALLLAATAPTTGQVEVVTTLTSYAAIADAVGGERVVTRSIAQPDEDAHFVKPKPSLALMLTDADLFITTGLDLEVWAPTLVDKSGNKRIRDGQPGFVSASHGVPLLDVPKSASRAAGDVHIFGNPHIHTSPLNAKLIAANIAAGLERVDPEGASAYRANLATFERRIDESLYGPELVELLGSATLDPLARAGTLIDFLSSRDYQGAPLVERLGGWLGAGMAFRGQKIITYHKNWVYFTTLFGLEVVDYVEAKPGIPPSTRHVHDLVELIDKDEIKVIWTASYFDPKKPQVIADRTGATAVIVPIETKGTSADDYFELIDLWVHQLAPTLGS